MPEREDIFGDGRCILYCGDCLAVLPTLEAGSVDAIVTDPPYGLSFMGKDWDHGVPGEHFWREALRVAKPGAHLLAFGGTRTFHRLAVAIEDAGWEIRDTVMWVYGSGFPKSLDVSKAIDKAAGKKREVVGRKWESRGGGGLQRSMVNDDNWQSPEITDAITAPATAAAALWDGWGTALKPAWEPIIVARKPLDGTVAANVLTHGTGGINIDGCRVGAESVVTTKGQGFRGSFGGGRNNNGGAIHVGRWPANLIHDGSEEVVGLFPHVSSGQPMGVKAGGRLNCYGSFAGGIPVTGYGDSGSAARFFYCAKASRSEREAGCEGLGEARGGAEQFDSRWKEGTGDMRCPRVRNPHPTVKPTALMQYLCRLVTPPGGIVVDPFAGSGSTGKAALLEGFRFVGIELDADYCRVAKARLRHAAGDAPLFAGQEEEGE